jgi:protocatechuate 3,4-dioxygenase, alpha subunit
VTPTETPGQTVGPFFSIGLSWLDGGDVVAADAPGAVVITGRVLDGAGDPVPDAVVETWQRNPDGFGRSSTDDDGRWRIRTVKPAAAGGAPHLAVLVYARGLLHRIATRIYFGDEPEANAADPVLASLPDDATRATLIAHPAADGYHHDIHLQGDHETTFFAL